MVNSRDEIQILDNPWRNVYFFARMLINSDQYGGLGNNTKRLLTLTTAIRTSFNRLDIKESDVNFFRRLIAEQVRSWVGKRYKKQARLYENFIEELCTNRLRTLQDVEVFCYTCERIVIPINESLKNIPSDDKDYAQHIVYQYLENKQELGLSNILTEWDNLGVEGCLDAERTEIVRIFKELKQHIDTENKEIDEESLILTAMVQEFERRVAQKRKRRGGQSLEDVTSLIFNFFKIPTSDGPEHFQADIEVDKWITTNDKFYIGVSCKRTLRERWKQISPDEGTLGRYKIKQIWHLITYPAALSEDMLFYLGSNRHIFYLPDHLPDYQEKSKHEVFKKYIRPLSEFVQDINKEING